MRVKLVFETFKTDIRRSCDDFLLHHLRHCRFFPLYHEASRMKEGRNSQRNKDVKNMNPPHFLCPKNLNGHFLYQNEIDVVTQKNTRHTHQNSENNSKSHTLIGL